MKSSNRLTSSARRNGSDSLLTRGILVGAAAACCTVAFAPGVSDRLFDQGVTCFAQRALGIQCPFCGMTHGVVALLRGDVVGSLAANAFAWVFVVALMIALAVSFGWRPPSRPRLLAGQRLPLLLGVALAAYSVGRNLV